jgi:hypothetical protein
VQPGPAFLHIYLSAPVGLSNKLRQVPIYGRQEPHCEATGKLRAHWITASQLQDSLLTGTRGCMQYCARGSFQVRTLGRSGCNTRCEYRTTWDAALQATWCICRPIR